MGPEHAPPAQPIRSKRIWQKEIGGGSTQSSGRIRRGPRAREEIAESWLTQSKETRAKAVVEALRPAEPSLGDLTPEEQSWLATTFAHLNRIYEKRAAGKPGNNAVCVCELGNVYVQFLAPWDAELLVCEAVSAKSVPEIAAILTKADEALRGLGFEAPASSHNYSQTLKIADVEDLAYAARLGFRVLKQVYRVADFGSATFKINIPSNMATDQNIGKTCLQTIASIWQVDDSAIKWVDDGFDWSPGSHLVRVRALPNDKSATEDRWRVSVQTDFLALVPIEDTKFVELIASQSGLLTSTYSMQYRPAEIWKDHSNGEKAKLSLFSSVYVDAELVQWLPGFLAQEAPVQVTNAEIQSAQMSEVVGGKPDSPPTTMIRRCNFRQLSV
jgi:hypothetical protein